VHCALRITVLLSTVYFRKVNSHIFGFGFDCRSIPHVHFQVATFPPETHDMPGAVTVQDRTRALMEDFPDPRWILGDIY